jgi:universal stress protein A
MAPSWNAWKRICCPVDFSPASEVALTTACGLARAFEAELTLLHVRTVPGSAIPEGMLEPTEEVAHDLSGPSDRPLVAWKARAEALGVAKVDATTSVGDPAQEIVELARRAGTDAIVLGTHGRRGLRHAVLGSVAEKVVRLAPCAVVTVSAETASRLR